MPQLHCTIHGRVQGVCFRAATQDQATSLGLMGWVRNRDDGSVECLAQGPQELLEKLLAWLHHGPSAAKVTQVETEWQPESKHHNHFSIV